MSSTEQAPEPTMDEILASIRKIISDDEPDQNAQAETGEAETGAADDYTASMADTPPPAEEPDDILDLTQVVEPQAEHADPQPETGNMAAAGAPQGDALHAAMSQAQAPVEPAGDASPDGSDIASLLAEAGVEDTVNEAGHAPQPEQNAEEASITAALNSIGAEPEPAAAQVPMDEPSAPETAIDPAGDMDPVPGDEARDALDDLVASLESEVNAGPDEPAIAQPEAIAADAALEAAMEMPAPDAAEPATGETDPAIAMPAPEDPVLSALVPEPVSEPETEPEPEPVMAEAPVEAPVEEDPDTEAAAADDETDEEPEMEAAAASSPFEPGIKDMLKPMLNKWLDDNMERIVHDAVKEEVASGKFGEK